VSPISGAVFSADGKRVATLSSVDHTLLIWDAGTGKMLSRIVFECRRDHDCAAYHGRRLMFRPGANTIASDNFVYDIETGRAVGKGKGANLVAVSPDGRLQATTPRDSRFRNSSVDVSDTATGRKILTLSLAERQVNAAAFSPDGRVLAVASYFWPGRGQNPPPDPVHLFQIPSGKLLRQFLPLNVGPDTLLFTPDGEVLVTASGWGKESIQVWRVADGQLLCKVCASKGANKAPIAVSADNNLLAFSNVDHSVVIWEIAAQQEVHRLEGNQRALGALAFSPDGKRLVSAGA